ncbi:MAG: neutral/alkaline non-lysosomal ceramidase N-terminal domain-containing protein [Armatimonadetes bacterium]|nr:neutral/alkaline non-lysosomal ceramidase N-terminal domain-containing protein [Armatimonadota bacterium]MDE2207421.1 neutral/alkaline non-lysosomal ceramidase N-terminal domain-containing protein [Armatimonadota bacterium]
MPLYAGVAEVDITPPLGVWMGGYGFRSEGARDVHDPLFARALVLDNGCCRLVLLVADLITLDQDLVHAVRTGVGEKLCVPLENVMLHCTHTHAGPLTQSYRAMGVRDEPYVQMLCRKLVSTAQLAAMRLQPARITYGDASVQIGVNRRNRDPQRGSPGVNLAGSVDGAVQCVCINTPEGNAIAVAFLHACHPTTMGGDNLAISAEWPGAAVSALRQRLDTEAVEAGRRQDAMAIALQGCCGDINPHPRGTWEQVAEYGARVANAAHAARWAAHVRAGESLEARCEVVNLPLLPAPPLEELRAEEAQWDQTLTDERKNGNVGRILHADARRQWARDAMVSEATQQPIELQCFHVGGIRILGIPAEVFVQYQLDFVKQSPEPALVLGYVNGCWNYLPTAAEFPLGGYEVAAAYRYYGTRMFAPECERLVRDAAYRLLGVADADTAPFPLVG